MSLLKGRLNSGFEAYLSPVELAEESLRRLTAFDLRTLRKLARSDFVKIDSKDLLIQ